MAYIVFMGTDWLMRYFKSINLNVVELNWPEVVYVGACRNGADSPEVLAFLFHPLSPPTSRTIGHHLRSTGMTLVSFCLVMGFNSLLPCDGSHNPTNASSFCFEHDWLQSPETWENCVQSLQSEKTKSRFERGYGDNTAADIQ